jgi:hypothetical protein
MFADLPLRAATAITAHLPTGAVPNPAPTAPPEIKAKVDSLIGFLRYGVIAACLAGVFLVAGKAALTHRRGELSDVYDLDTNKAYSVNIGPAGNAASPTMIASCIVVNPSTGKVYVGIPGNSTRDRDDAQHS